MQDKATADLAAAKQALAKPGAKPLAVAFSADAQKVAAFFDDGALKCGPSLRASLSSRRTGTAAAKTTLTASPDGSFTAARSVILATGGTPLGCWSGRSSGDALADRVNAVRFSPDGKTLAVGGGEPSRSGDISLWDVAGGKLVKTWPERHTDAVLSLDFSPDGKLLASGGADKIARVTDIASGKQVNLFEGHTHHVHGRRLPRRWPRARQRRRRTAWCSSGT